MLSDSTNLPWFNPLEGPVGRNKLSRLWPINFKNHIGESVVESVVLSKVLMYLGLFVIITSISVRLSELLKQVGSGTRFVRSYAAARSVHFVEKMLSRRSILRLPITVLKKM